jgi:hypothetical protein
MRNLFLALALVVASFVFTVSNVLAEGIPPTP